MSQLYIGLMSGTSLDGIDAALVDFSSDRPTVQDCVFLPMPETLRSALLALCNAPTVTFAELTRCDIEIARLSAAVTRQLLETTKLPTSAITAIGSHGQTIFHHPSGPSPTSIQIGDPNLIAELTGITTVADFRRRDIAANGQGAPLVPAFHQAIFRSANEHRVVLNIGGIANITVLAPERDVIGFDTGPGNVLMDYWIGQHKKERYDAHGAWAASGQINTALLASMLNDPYFSSPPPKSTGRELFNAEWLSRHLTQAAPTALAQDVQATLCALTAHSIARAITNWAGTTQRIIVCGGGNHNAQLINEIQKATALPVESSAHFGIEPDWVEATAFAWLAKQCMEKKAGNLPAVTGATRPVILGGIYQA